jgi:hypothetical protein
VRIRGIREGVSRKSGEDATGQDDEAWFGWSGGDGPRRKDDEVGEREEWKWERKF